MKRIIQYFLIIIFISPFFSNNTDSIKSIEFENQKFIPIFNYSNFPYFLENKGQWDEDILFFYCDSNQNKMIVKRDCIFHIINNNPGKGEKYASEDQYSYFRLSFDNVDHFNVIGIDPVETIFNFFIGNISEKWASDVRCFRSIEFKDSSDGTFLSFSSINGHLHHELFSIEGEEQSLISISFSDANGKQNHEPLLLDHFYGKYFLEEELSTEESNTPPFSLNKIKNVEYHENAINFSTFIGGSGYEEPASIIQDIDNNYILCGHTSSFDFPVSTNAFDTVYNEGDAVIIKIDRNGEKILTCSFIGGGDFDSANSIIMDGRNIIISGRTTSDDFPISEYSYDSILDGRDDMFISKLDNNLSTLISSTYFGGNGNDFGEASGLFDNYIVLSGSTNSVDFPITEDAFQNKKNAMRDLFDTFITLFDIDNMLLNYSTYIGGSENDQGAVAALYNNYIIIGGDTRSSDLYFDINSFQSTLKGGHDCFILKFDLEKKDIVFSTLFGGSEYLEYLRCIDVNENGDIIAGGETYSSDLPVTVGSEITGIIGKPGGFLFGLNSNGSKLSLCAYLGNIWGIVCDKNSYIHVTGFLPSQTETNISSRVLDPIAQGDVESFYMKFNENLTKLHYTTYLGGNGFDMGYTILIDESNYEVIIAGVTTSNDFPMKPGSFDTTYNGDNDIFLIKFNLTRTPSVPENITDRSGESFVELSWDPPQSDGGSPVDVYAVFKKPRGIDPFEMIGETRSLTFNDTDVENGREYYYYVRAHNWIGYGPPSKEISVIPLSIPSPPRNLTVDMTGDETIKLKWEDPRSDGGLILRGFYLHKITEGEPSPERIPLTSNDYTDWSVINGVNYGYYLTAWNDIGESLPSNMVNATPMTTPVSIKNITVESGNNFVLLKWEYPSDDGGSPVIEFTVHRSDGETTIKYTIGSGSTECNDTDVINGNRYWYQVSSRNEMGNSPLSISVIGDPIGPPLPPNDLIADSSSGTVKLTWKAPYHNGGSKLLGYRVYRNSDGEEWMRIIDLDNLAETYTDRYLDNGKTYGYRVTAYNKIGESPFSNTVEVEPLGPPGMPNDLDLIPGDGYIEVTWKEPYHNGGSQILNYRLYRGEGENDLLILKTIPADSVDFNDTEVINGREYFYSLLAINDIGDGPPTEIQSAIPGGKPTPPTNILITPGDGYIEISWEAPADDGGFSITRVNVFRGSDNDDLEKVFGTDQGSGSYRDDGLENGKTYYYYLTCMNSIGESEFSDILDATPLGIPSVPLSITAKALSSDSIEVSWSPPEEDGGSRILHYKVYRYLMNDLISGEDRVVMEVDGNITKFIDRGLSSGGSYIYRVSAVNSQGESELSEPDVASTSNDDSEFSFLTILIVIFVLVISIGGIIFFIWIRRKENNPIDEFYNLALTVK